MGVSIYPFYRAEPGGRAQAPASQAGALKWTPLHVATELMAECTSGTFWGWVQAWVLTGAGGLLLKWGCHLELRRNQEVVQPLGLMGRLASGSHMTEWPQAPCIHSEP